MQKKTIANIVTFSFILFLFLGQVDLVGAQNPPAPGGGQESIRTGENQSFPNPLGTTDYVVVVGNIVKAILGIVGVLALIVFIYGGITWMTSMGNMQRVKTARDTLIGATIGLIIVFGSFAVVNLVLSAFTS